MRCYLLVLRRVGPWAAGLLLLLAASGPARAQQPADHAPAPTSARQAAFFALLAAGDSVYARKEGDRSLASSLRYYTRAQELAAAANDTLLLAEAVFARGRVYDAWNKEPYQTVRYFQQATDLFRRLPAQRLRYYYAWHLVAHAYDKVPDTLRATAVLRAMQRVLVHEPATRLRQLPFTVEMALAATEVGHYGLADTLLRTLVRRAWVRNDPETYDHLTHYYLVQARLDVYYRGRVAPAYLDSLQQAAARTRPAPDRLFYTQCLARLTAAARQYPLAYAYLRQSVRLGDSLHDGADISQLRTALLHAQETADQQERQADARTQATRNRAIWLLSGALGIISLLTFYLARQSRLARRQTQHLGAANQQLGAVNEAMAHVNHQLDEKVAQVELLNKEIQHRVKNNLHILFSLLRMQERRTTSPEVLAQLQAARLRVESIATLHNQLMRHPGELPLAEFLRSLVATAVACLANDRQVMTHLQTDPVALDPDSYFPLSLILNEWVTNSIKYADTQGELLELTIRVSPYEGGTCLSYADNGRAAALATGAGPPATAPPAPGLGTQIITLLARQLRATLRTPQPYQFELCIPIPPTADDDGTNP